MELLFLNLFLAALPGGIIIFLLIKLSSLKVAGRETVLFLFLGAISILPAAFLEAGMLSGLKLFILPERFLSILLRAFFIAGLVEEGIKFAVISLTTIERRRRGKEFRGAAPDPARVHPLVAGIITAVGFGFGENILYVFGPPSHLILRGVTAVALHAITGAMIGYFLWKKEGGRGFLFALLFHGFYDFFLFNPGVLPYAVVPLLSIGIWFLIRMVKMASSNISEAAGPRLGSKDRH